MTFAELQDEFYARGFDYANQDTAGQTRAKRWLNQSYLELCEEDAWPFLEEDSSGAAPLAVSDVRQVLSVTCPTFGTVLGFVDRRTLVDLYEDLTQTGSPIYWYLDDNTLRVYPASTESITVRYLKVPSELSADADEPVIPTRFHDLIVDGAVLKALKDADNFEALASLKAVWVEGVERMRRALMNRNYDQPDFIVRANYWTEG